MSGSVDLNKAVAALWLVSGLDELIKSYWSVASASLYPTLSEAEAAPGTPMPFATFAAAQPSVDTRMSAAGRRKQHIRSQTWTFDLYTTQTDDKSAKEVAAEIADEILQVFGGHPSETPSAMDMELDNGQVLNVQYQSDHYERQGDTAYLWQVSYSIKTDVPAMV